MQQRERKALGMRLGHELHVLSRPDPETIQQTAGLQKPGHVAAARFLARFGDQIVAQTLHRGEQFKKRTTQLLTAARFLARLAVQARGRNQRGISTVLRKGAERGRPADRWV